MCLSLITLAFVIMPESSIFNETIRRICLRLISKIRSVESVKAFAKSALKLSIPFVGYALFFNSNSSLTLFVSTCAKVLFIADNVNIINRINFIISQCLYPFVQ